MADSTLTPAERTRLEQRRERLMKLLQEGSGTGTGATLDAEDRADLEQEWNKLDQLLNRR